MDPGNRVDLPKTMLVLLISTKYLVSVNSLGSVSVSDYALSAEVAGGCS